MLLKGKYGLARRSFPDWFLQHFGRGRGQVHGNAQNAREPIFQTHHVHQGQPLRSVELRHQIDVVTGCATDTTTGFAAGTGARVASYLLARERIIVILRYRAGDGSKTFVRLFLRAKGNPKNFAELVPVFRLLRNRLCASVVEKIYKKNPELAPPFPRPLQWQTSRD